MANLGQRSRQRFLSWWLLAFVWSVPFVAPLRMWAQAPAPAASPAAGATDSAQGKPADQNQQQSLLMWIIRTSGWIGAILLATSFYFVALVVRLFIELRTEVVMPPELMTLMESQLKSRDYNGIYRSAKENGSELGMLIAAGMAALAQGLSEAREAIDRLAEAITVEMEKRISMLAVIGSLGPMIGLLGTLKGMISSFSAIAMSGTQMKASEVAHGISEALLLTFEGVAISVPAIYFFALFKNRVSTLSVQAATQAEEFMRRVNATAQSKSPPPSGSSPA